MKKNLPRTRCHWAGDKLDMIAYHDEEWGVPTRDDAVHFEFLVLESAQAGLSWYTVLRKRENYRKLFAGFDAKKVARFTPAKIEKILLDPGIIRNRLKVEAAVNNARRFLEIQKEFGSFSAYAWSFVGGKPILNRVRGRSDLQATSPESDRWSLDLKKRGFKFLGSTVLYAHMQATGMVNDHALDCFRRKATPRALPRRSNRHAIPSPDK